MLVQQAIGLGKPAVVALQAVIVKEMAADLQRYRDRFQKQAALIVKKKVAKIDMAEVAGLRRTVLSLRESADFSKQAIVAKGDPAMQRLAEIFLVHRTDVLASSEKLQEERLKLGGIGGVWEACEAYLFSQLPNDESKPTQPMTFDKYLEGEEELAVGLAAPMDETTRQTLMTNSQLAAQLDPEEARAILALNLTRNLLGLPALVIDPKLCDTARDHSNDMRELKFFAHESPVEGKKTPWDRGSDSVRAPRVRTSLWVSPTEPPPTWHGSTVPATTRTCWPIISASAWDAAASTSPNSLGSRHLLFPGSGGRAASAAGDTCAKAAL